MAERIEDIKTKFYYIVSPTEIKRRGFTNDVRLAWHCLNQMEQDDDVTWDEAQEAASLMLGEIYDA